MAVHLRKGTAISYFHFTLILRLFHDDCTSIVRYSLARDMQLFASSIVIELYRCYPILIQLQVRIPIERTTIVMLWM